MEQEIGEFHWTDGWYFKRLDNGAVRIRQGTTTSAIIPAAEWASIIAHVSARGEPGAYVDAERFHMGAPGESFIGNLYTGIAVTVIEEKM